MILRTKRSLPSTVVIIGSKLNFSELIMDNPCLSDPITYRLFPKGYIADTIFPVNGNLPSCV